MWLVIIASLQPRALVPSTSRSCFAKRPRRTHPKFAGRDVIRRCVPPIPTVQLSPASEELRPTFENTLLEKVQKDSATFRHNRNMSFSRSLFSIFAIFSGSVVVPTLSVRLSFCLGPFSPDLLVNRLASRKFFLLTVDIICPATSPQLRCLLCLTRRICGAYTSQMYPLRARCNARWLRDSYHALFEQRCLRHDGLSPTASRYEMKAVMRR